MIIHYRDMAGDAVRVDAFRRGIEAAVRPGDVAIDLGCGLGTYALFACRAGARKVYAIEREPVILAARQIAKKNGYADRIVFVRADARTVELPEKADVLVTEDFSATFIEAETADLIAGARRRLLKPSGTMVPASVEVFGAPAHCPGLYARMDRWAASEEVAYGIDFSPTRDMAMNCIHQANFRLSHLLGPPKRLHRVDLGAPTPFPFDTVLRVRARKNGTVHGLAVWFEAQLAPRVRLSNAPGQPPTLWGQGLLPLARPIRVRKHAMITVDVAVRFSRDSDRAWWQWEVSAGGERADGTTFRSFPTSQGDLEAGSRRHRPGLSPEGEITVCVLRMLKTGCTILEVARRLRRRFPRRFGALRDALNRAAADARRFGRPAL